MARPDCEPDIIVYIPKAGSWGFYYLSPSDADRLAKMAPRAARRVVVLLQGRQMIFSHRLAIAFAFVLSGCAHKPAPVFENMAECKDIKLPSDAEFRAMRFSELYPWHQEAKHSQDLLANATVLHKPIDPCITALAYKGDVIDQAMKYAY